MRILFLSSQLPFSGSRFGGAKRLYLLARELARKHELRCVAMDGCGEIGLLPGDGALEFPQSLIVRDGMAKTWWERRVRTPMDFRGALNRSAADIRAFIGNGIYDAVLIAYPAALSFIPMLPEGARRNLVYLEDDLFLEQLRKRISAARNPLRRLARQVFYRQGVAFYWGSLAAVEKLVAISREEEEILHGHFPSLRTHVLPYGIDLADFPLLPPASPLRLGFIGNYAHQPNQDAVEFCLASLWPSLKELIPEATLDLAGPGLPAALQARAAQTPGVTHHGAVADLGAFYARIGTFFNPVFTGRGMRTKLLEAAAFGRPILTTPLGAEGLNGFRLELAETPEAFAAGLRRIAEQSTGIIVANRQRVEEDYSIGKVAAGLESFIESATSSAPRK